MPNKNTHPRKSGAAGAIVRPAKNKNTKIIRTTGHRWSNVAESIFLEHLAASANVLASAAEAGFSSTAIYKRRMKEPGFAARWQQALEQGYARLEMQLVETATSSLAGDEIDGDKAIPRMTAAEAINLLKLHRAQVHGGKTQRYDWRMKLPDIETVRAEVLRKIEAMGRPSNEQQS
jgi:hypothetical protein